MADAKGKPAAKAEKKFSKSTLFDTKGATVRKNKSCPKCGPGVYLAKHATREACGNCGYTEWKTKSTA
jgi:small subunit ribosomal protein S27Ae